MAKGRLAIVFVVLQILAFEYITAQSELPKNTNFEPLKSVSFFTENKGQIYDQLNNVRSDILFLGETRGMTYHIRGNGVSYQFSRVDSWKVEDTNRMGKVRIGEIKCPDEMTIYRTDINWLGTNDDFTIIKGKARHGYDNYYLPVCPKGITDVKTYESVTYQNIYDGIDLKWYNKNGEPEYDYIISPGTDYQQIKWEIKGAENIYINESGDLVIQTPLGNLHQLAPMAYQVERKIDVKWKLEDNIIGFEVDNYDPTLTLIIDPILKAWATYYGGSGGDNLYFVSSDGSNIFGAGMTNSSATGLATSGSHQSSYKGNNDAFLVKFNSQGIRLWGTYYGGSLNDYSFSCTSDGSNVFLTGYTESPTSDSVISTPGAHQTIKSTGLDAFLVKFNSNGVRIWGTYYGGLSTDYGESCSSDGTNVYLAGSTYSSNAIATSGAHQPVLSGWDGFLVKFDGNGVRQWGTYYGGTTYDYGYFCFTDGTYVYLAGEANSANAIATSGTHQTIHAGGRDGYLVKFNSSGVRQWGTYYGGSNHDISNSITTDGSDVYLSGYTISSTGIASTGAHKTIQQNQEAFLVRFNSDGIRQWGTYFGGSEHDVSYSSMNRGSKIFLVGITPSGSGIATPGSYKPVYGGFGDAFIAIFDTSGSQLYGTYCGVNGPAHGYSCLNDSAIYICGRTSSGNNLTTPGAHQTTNAGGGGDGYLIKFIECEHNTDSIVVTACVSYISPSGKYTWTTSGFKLDTLVNAGGCDSLIIIDLTIVPLPTITSVIPNSRCDSGIVALNATASAGQVNWYIDSTSSFVLFSGGTYSPNLSGSHTYFVHAKNGNCTSALRTPVTATVYNTPYIISVSPASRCDSGIVFLSATSNAGTVYWYNAPTGGTVLASGNTYSPAINLNTIFYVNSVANGCTTATRTPVSAIVLPIPGILSYTTDERCDSGLINLTATSSSGLVSWYDSITGGNLLDTGNNFLTSISFSTNYFVDATDSGCTTVSRTTVSATINNSQFVSVEDTACFEYISPSGKYLYTNSGIYLDTLSNVFGCDSVITIDLIINTIDTTVTQNGKSLTAGATLAKFQWINCANNAIMNGDTGNLFIATFNGNFAVIVSKDGCSDTSKCYEIKEVGVFSVSSDDFLIYPNPVSDRVNIEFGKVLVSVKMILKNDLGQVVFIQEIENSEATFLNMKPYSKGLYHLQILSGDLRKSYQLIKE